MTANPAYLPASRKTSEIVILKSSRFVRRAGIRCGLAAEALEEAHASFAAPTNGHHAETGGGGDTESGDDGSAGGGEFARDVGEVDDPEEHVHFSIVFMTP